MSARATASGGLGRVLGKQPPRTFRVELAPGHADAAGRVVQEARSRHDFRLRARIDRPAHLEFVRSS